MQHAYDLNTPIVFITTGYKIAYCTNTTRNGWCFEVWLTTLFSSVAVESTNSLKSHIYKKIMLPLYIYIYKYIIYIYIDMYIYTPWIGRSHFKVSILPRTMMMGGFSRDDDASLAFRIRDISSFPTKQTRENQHPSRQQRTKVKNKRVIPPYDKKKDFRSTADRGLVSARHPEACVNMTKSYEKHSGISNMFEDVRGKCTEWFWIACGQIQSYTVIIWHIDVIYLFFNYYKFLIYN